MTRTVLKINGMDYVEVVTILKRKFGPVVGGEEHLVLDARRGKMTAGRHHPGRCSGQGNRMQDGG